MDILYGYLRNYWKYVALALVLAATNQVFSLLDPLIFRHIIDSYATRYQEYTTSQFIRGVSVLLGAAVRGLPHHSAYSVEYSSVIRRIAFWSGPEEFQ